MVRLAQAGKTRFRVGIIATSMTIGTGLYQNALHRRLGDTAEVVTPDERAQLVFQDAIRSAKAGDRSEGLIASTLAEAEALVSPPGGAPCDVLLLGCTEMPLLLNEARFKSAPIVDPLRLLATEIVAFTRLHAA